MSGASNGESNLTNHDELREWLNAQPREPCIVIAARAALRVAALVGRVTGSIEPRRFEERIFATFWASAVAWASAKYPARMDELRPSADKANEAAYDSALGGHEDGVAGAASFAAATAYVTDPDFLSDTAGSTAALAAFATDDEVWAMAIADAHRLNDKSLSSSDLASAPLWLDRAPPDWAVQGWSELLGGLKGENWGVWLDWYQRRLDGRADAEEIELLFATLPTNPREKDPAEQNAALAAAIERLRK